MTILGRYLSKMKLNQYKAFRWKDTEFLQQLAEKELRETMQRQGKDIQEITLALEEQKAIAPAPVEVKSLEEVVYSPPSDGNSFTSMEFSEQTESAEELGLTEEDVRYLRLRWGKAYKPSE